MRQSKHTRWLLALLLLAALTMAAAFASAEQGTLTVRVGEENSAYDRGGIGINLYKIGEMREDNTWWINSAFSGIDILGAQTTAQIDAAANQVADILRDSAAPVTVNGTTDAEGTLVFTRLDPGIYFGQKADDREELTMQNFLISVPYFENGRYQYSATVRPKMTSTPPTPSPSPSPTPTPTVPHPWEEIVRTYLPDPTPTPPPTPTPANPYNLTVIYIYENGSPAWPTHYEPGLWPGTPYDVVSPVIPGYVATILRVSGTMPHHDVVYTVVYIPRNSRRRLINLDDYETPLGLGEIQIHVGVCYE